MPWCPNCRVEYREGFKVCNDCEIELVDELEPEKDEYEPDESVLTDQLVFLTSVPTGMEFEMTEALLRPYGIVIMKKAKRLGSSIIGETHSGIEIYVLSSQFDQAKDIIDNCPREISEEELIAQAEQYEPESDEIDEAEEEEDMEIEEQEEEEVQNAFVLDDKDGVKSTYLDFKWLIVFVVLAIVAVYIIVRLWGK